jgi:hypothetical protein
MKKRTLDELRQVKEYGWTPKPAEDLVKTSIRIKQKIQAEINSKQDQIAQKLDMILDLEDMIMTEMTKVGLGYPQYPEHEFEVDKAFEELFEYALKDLRYHYFNTN